MKVHCDFTIYILKSTHSNILSMSEIEICPFFTVKKNEKKNNLKLNCICLTWVFHKFFRWSGLVDVENERKIKFIFKKHQTKWEFMAMWIFEQKMKSTHVWYDSDRCCRSLAVKKILLVSTKYKANEWFKNFFLHIFQENNKYQHLKRLYKKKWRKRKIF